jgi:hypothetical protein
VERARFDGGSQAEREDVSKHFPSTAIHRRPAVTLSSHLAVRTMTLDFLTRTAYRILLGGAVLVATPFLAGCSGNDTQSDSSTTQQPSQSSQQQGQPGQMPGSGQTLSSSDVNESQVQTAAQIASSIQMGTRADRMKMRKDMKEKYGNPQQMDSTQKAQARKEMRRRQMKMRKEAKKAGMDPQMFRQIMRSAQQDSTLQKRLQTAMKAQMQKRMKQQLQKRKQQGGGPSNP